MKPQFDESAEMAVLGAILFDHRKAFPIVENKGVTVDSFFSLNNKVLYQSMLKMQAAGKPIDILTIVNHLDSNKALDKVGGESYVNSVFESCRAVSHCEYYSDLVIKKQKQRKLQEAAMGISSMAHDDVDPDEIIVKAEEAFISVSNTSKGTAQSMNDMSSGLIEKWKLSVGRGYVGVPSRFKGINGYTGGYRDSLMTLVASRPGKGKTTLICNDGLYQAQNGFNVGVFSIEMPGDQLIGRMASDLSGVSAYAMDLGRASTDQMDRMFHAVDQVKDLPIFIEDRPMSIEKVCSAARHMLMKYKIDIFYLDYIQLLTTDRAVGNDNQRVGYFSNTLTNLAKEMKVPWVCVSQLSRAYEQDTERKNYGPRLSDLRDSGSLEQDAYTVMFIYDNPESPDDQSVVNIAKHRGGPVGRMILNKNFKHHKFENREEVKENA